jgi:hypothetical protein
MLSNHTIRPLHDFWMKVFLVIVLSFSLAYLLTLHISFLSRRVKVNFIWIVSQWNYEMCMGFFLVWSFQVVVLLQMLIYMFFYSYITCVHLSRTPYGAQRWLKVTNVTWLMTKHNLTTTCWLSLVLIVLTCVLHGTISI